MASIQKRNKKYAVVYTYEDAEGIKRQKWESFDTFAQAKERKIKVESELINGTFIPPSATTVSEFMELFVELHGSKNWSMSTYQRSKRIIANYINPFIGKIKLQSVTPLMIEKYYKQLLKTRSVNNKYHKSKVNVSTGTVREIHKLLKCAFGVAINWDLISTNPFLKVKPPKHVYEKRQIWNSETIMKALDVCEDPKLIIAIHLSFACSLRLGEVLGLQWKDVHINDEDILNDDAHINVVQQLESVSVEALEVLERKDVLYEFTSEPSKGKKSVVVLKKPKTLSSIRKVWLPKTLAYILREWKKEQDEYKEFFGPEYKPYDLVVCFEDGRYCSHGVIRHSLKTLIEENDLPPIVFHSLRHSSTTYKLKLNHGDIKATQGDTGHAQADMVTEVYGHIIDEDRKVNAQKFNETFYSGKAENVESKRQNSINVDELINAIKKDPQLMDQLVKALS